MVELTPMNQTHNAQRLPIKVTLDRDRRTRHSAQRAEDHFRVGVSQINRLFHRKEECFESFFRRQALARAIGAGFECVLTDLSSCLVP